MTTYTQLQAQAKALGIKANQKAEVLVAEIKNAQANPFNTFKSEMHTLADKMQAEHDAKATVVTRPRGGITEKQEKYLSDLRNRHHVPLTGIELLTFAQANQEISALRDRPAPASDAQLEKIGNIMEEMRQHGAKISISEEKINSLTGGRDGTASKMIEFLNAKKAELNIVAPASEAQVKTISEWFLCPDIPFEDFNVTKKVMMPDVSATAWRYFTPEEFKAEITSAMTKQEASRFIDQYRGTFYDWKKTRITQAQMKHIRQLDERLANIESQAEVTFAQDLDGNVVEVSTANKNTYNPRAHEPLTEQQLMQMSFKEASTLIDQMKSEQSERYASIDKSQDQQNLQDKFAKFDELTGVGSAKNANDARSNEFHRLSDLIYKLEAVAGQQNEELHALIQEVLVDGGGNADIAKTELKAFMHLCVDRANKERAYRTAGALLQIAEDTVIGTAIAEEVNTEVETEYAEAV